VSDPAIGRLLVFGDGDLTTRYVLPAIGELLAAGRLPADFRVDVTGRSDTSTEDYRARLATSLGSAGGLDDHERRDLCARVDRHRADAGSVDDVRPLLGDDPVVVYLALPPAVFPAAVEAVADAGLPEGSRVVLEKPFGTDLASARELNELLHRCVDERAVYRIDHFLGLRTAHNVLGVRFGNRLFEPAWSDEHVAEVEIVWDETLALEGRGGYYDGTGALRDMVQSHLLQLLCLVAMARPGSLDPAALGERKLEVLRATRLWEDDPRRCTVRARYTAGTVGDRDVPAYVDEDGVDPARATETFAQVVLRVDTPRWRRTSFVLRTGKALGRDRHEVAVRFRPPSSGAGFGGAVAARPSTLRFSVGPDAVHLELAVATGEEAFELEQVAVHRELPGEGLSPYALLLSDVVAGRSTLSVGDVEVEEAWRVVQPVLDAWEDGVVPLREYPAGSFGP
jgi:glucose-6-phosphate 1-dehydrogenase